MVRWLLFNSQMLMFNANEGAGWSPLKQSIGVVGKNLYNLRKYEILSMYIVAFTDREWDIQQFYLLFGEAEGFGG